jgi:hypothetical protein
VGSGQGAPGSGWGRGGRYPIHPGGISEVWQMLGLEIGVFGSVAMVGLTGEFSELWQGKDLEKYGKSAGRNVRRWERREYPLPAVYLER